MRLGAGVGLIVGGALVSLLVLFGGWRRLSPVVAFCLLVACGAAIGAGGLLVQDDAGAASWVITLGLLGALSPIHGRLVFGRPGPVD